MNNVYPLIDYTEHWASIYKPMMHNTTDNRRFFCIESIGQIANLVTQVQSVKGPFVVIETNIGGTVTERFMTPEYGVYFFQKSVAQKLQSNDTADAEAKSTAMKHALAYLNRIRQDQQEGQTGTADALAGIDLEEVRFETFGPLFNRWFAVGISLRNLQRFSRCVNADDYDE